MRDNWALLYAAQAAAARGVPVAVAFNLVRGAGRAGEGAAGAGGLSRAVARGVRHLPRLPTLVPGLRASLRRRFTAEPRPRVHVAAPERAADAALASASHPCVPLPSGAPFPGRGRARRRASARPLQPCPLPSLPLPPPLHAPIHQVTEFLGAGARQFGFMLRGLRQLEPKLAAAGIPFFLLQGGWRACCGVLGWAGLGF